MTGSTPEWQRRRAGFNHDWLKNQYMPALAKCLNLLDDRLEDPHFERNFVSAVLPQWETHYSEVKRLVREFETEMSPVQIVRNMFPNGSAEDGKWLEDLMHSLWFARYPIREWMTQAEEKADAAHAAYQRLQEALEACSNRQSAEALRPHRALFAAFRDRCMELGRAIEQFPSEIKVT